MAERYNCPACGEPNEAGQHFCTNCGSSLLETCPTCSSTNAPGAKFCGSCGTQLVRQEEESKPPAEERRLATVLFADISGFTGLSEGADPEELRSMVDSCMAKLGAIVGRYEGVVDKVIGDALMAVFGAPVAHGDDPERAVRAALEMQRCAAENSREFADLPLRVGVNTGEVFLASVGPDERPTVIGDAVNTAQRLQSEAPPGGVYVGEETWQATQRTIDYVDAGMVSVKGKKEALRVFTPVAAPEAGAERRAYDVPLLGRDYELNLLRDLWQRVAGDHRPHLVTVIGPPGIGKTRLASELGALVKAQGSRVLRGRSLPYGETTGFGALAQQVKQLAEIFESDSAAVARGKLDRTLTELLGADGVSDLSSHLATLIGLAGEEAAPTEKHVLFLSVRRFVEALAGLQPTLLVFEDIHWADASLLELLEHLATRLRELPVLLLTLARPELFELRRGWGGGLPAYTALPLEPLGAETAHALVGHLLAGRPEPVGEDVAARLEEIAEGNPLFIEELAASLLERPTDTAEALPSTVKGIIAARLDALPADERATLLDASVIGKVFWQGALARLAGRNDHLSDIVDSLEQRNLIRREPKSALEGEEQFSFRHILIREVAYGTLPKSVRRERHAAVALFLEEAGGDRAGASVAALAHHWEEAGEISRAVDYLVLAAEQAARAWAKHEAVAFYTRALEIMPPQDDRARTIRLRRALALVDAGEFEAAGPELDPLLEVLEGHELVEALAGRFRASFWGQNDAERSRHHSARMLAQAEELGDDELRAVALSKQAAAVAMNGAVEDAIALGGEGLALWKEGARQSDRAETLEWYSLHHYWLGRYREAISPAEEAIRVGSDVHSIFGLVNGHADLGMALTGLGRHEEALEVFARGTAHGRELELQPRFTARIMNMWAGTHRELYELDEAERLNREAIEGGERLSFSGAIVSGQIDLVALDLLRGEIGRAELALPKLQERAAETKGWHQWLWTTRVAQAGAETALAAGLPGQAAERAEAALDLATRYGRRKYVVASRTVLGASLRALGRREEAVTALRTALAEAEALEHPPSIWRAAAELANALALNGDDDAAGVAIGRARESLDGFTSSLSTERRAHFLAAPALAELLAVVR